MSFLGLGTMGCNFSLGKVYNANCPSMLSSTLAKFYYKLQMHCYEDYGYQDRVCKFSLLHNVLQTYIR